MSTSELDPLPTETSKPSPGPWFVADHDDFVVAAGDGFSICDCVPGNPYDVSDSQGVANARLIAAAPDLYTALNDILGSFDLQTMDEILRKDHDPHDEDEFCVNLTAKQLRTINQAILKAEGKS